MNKELYKIAAKACKAVYDDNKDIGTTEFKISTETFNGSELIILAIAGSNEFEDWLINFNLFSKDGIKIGANMAAEEIKKYLDMILPNQKKNTQLLVCGHSKAGATAIAYKKLFGADYCVAFAPARSLRYWTNRKMENTTLFIDPDDPVSKVGCFSFGHPKCEIIEAKDDHFLPSISDHSIDNWIEFINRKYRG